MKKISLALLSLTSLGTAAMANNGFYLGASAGVANTYAKYDNQTINPTSSAATFTPEQYARHTKADAGKPQGLFGLFAGFGSLVGSGVYFGGEIFGGVDTTKLNPFDDSATGSRIGVWKTDLKRNHYYGLAARLGFMMTPNTMAYLRLAAEAGKWRSTVTPNAATVDHNASSSATPEQISASKAVVNKNKNSIQFAPGAGIEVHINKNMFVRAEYSYLFGPKLNLAHTTTALNPSLGLGTGVNHNLKTTQHAVKVGLGYKF